MTVTNKEEWIVKGVHTERRLTVGVRNDGVGNTNKCHSSYVDSKEHTFRL